MSSPGSISHWISALKDGNSAAAQALWERYYSRLIALARKKLQPTRSRVADEEDVVQNAFHSFFRAVAQGRFPQLNERDGLWRLLVAITANKALKQLEHEHRQKRRGTPAPVPIGTRTQDPDDAALLEVVGEEPTPDFAALVADEYRRLLDLLGDDTLRQVAVWKMEGYDNDEIAGQLACSRRTVARKLEAIRILWNKEPAT
jgi:DNA-directed RNA polymerase specialized sigma24 family protein